MEPLTMRPDGDTMIVTPPSYLSPTDRSSWQAGFLRAFHGEPAEDPREIRVEDLSDLEQRDVDLEDEELRTDPREIATQ